ncbi:MAG TPA: acetate--CoA ligase family protein, partial [Actinophytocola sp.]|uniref:acetate--CoA ligase family protein n=1 Tax=Actinophytocola sp. TaxID=1872138 RepID=UPI002DDD2564
VDVAVVAVPAESVQDVVLDCAAKGVHGLVVISSGFAEIGEEGRVRQRKLVGLSRSYGLRLIGPNALGIINTDSAVSLNASLSSLMPPRGRAGFFCQSGALGTAILADAEARGLGLSTFVSAGNRADVSGNDLLQYWETDPATDLVLLYLETFGNPRKFARLARRLGRTKPIVAVKSGRDSVVPALFEQNGLIRVETLAQLFDTAVLLAHQPLPRGPRVAVVGNSSAIGLLAADAAVGYGLELAGDPLDVGVDAGPDAFAGAVAESLRRPEVDALIVVFVPPLAVPGTAYARAVRSAIAELDESRHKPLVSTFLAVEGIPEDLGIPSYPSPERAALALARVSRYARWRAAPPGRPVRPAGVDPDAARAIATTSGDGPVELDDRAVERLLACYGIRIVPYARVSTVDEAIKAGLHLGFPVAMKATGEQFWRRTDLIGVRLDLTTEEAVRDAYADLREVSGVDDVYVQRMAPKGTACAIGVQDDPSFGTLVSFGLSGVISDLLEDRAYRAVPLTDTDVAALIRAPKAAPLLTGYAGTPSADLPALEDLVLRVAALAEDVPEVRWLSLEPILASPQGAFVTGGRITVGPPPTRQDTGPRRLR